MSTNHPEQFLLLVFKSRLKRSKVSYLCRHGQLLHRRGLPRVRLGVGDVPLLLLQLVQGLRVHGLTDAAGARLGQLGVDGFREN